MLVLGEGQQNFELADRQIDVSPLDQRLLFAWAQREVGAREPLGAWRRRGAAVGCWILRSQHTRCSDAARRLGFA
jgi:hypothetical protein